MKLYVQGLGAALGEVAAQHNALRHTLADRHNIFHHKRVQFRQDVFYGLVLIHVTAMKGAIGVLRGALIAYLAAFLNINLVPIQCPNSLCQMLPMPYPPCCAGVS